ncbi:hypothetical protein C8R43DRAFT_1130859 [Mycena crocata]|nr:hypothetical protein C8R43DRAFT_1130859 [Mycena crocata]
MFVERPNSFTRLYKYSHISLPPPLFLSPHYDLPQYDLLACRCSLGCRRSTYSSSSHSTFNSPPLSLPLPLLRSSSSSRFTHTNQAIESNMHNIAAAVILIPTQSDPKKFITHMQHRRHRRRATTRDRVQAITMPLKGYLPQQYSSTSSCPVSRSAAQKILFNIWKSRKQGYVSKGSINLVLIGGTQHHSKPDSNFWSFCEWDSCRIFNLNLAMDFDYDVFRGSRPRAFPPAFLTDSSI